MILGILNKHKSFNAFKDPFKRYYTLKKKNKKKNDPLQKLMNSIKNEEVVPYARFSERKGFPVKKRYLDIENLLYKSRKFKLFILVYFVWLKTLLAKIYALRGRNSLEILHSNAINDGFTLCVIKILYIYLYYFHSKTLLEILLGFFI